MTENRKVLIPTPEQIGLVKRGLVHDALTGLLTPHGEELSFGSQRVTGRIFVDWHDMHSAYSRYGDEEVAKELTRVAGFLREVYRDHPDTCLTYVSGDNFLISSSRFTDNELLNTLHAHREDFQGMAHLLCGEGFPDPLTEEVYYYWQRQPEHRFQLVTPENGKTVCTFDLRHLRGITEELGMQVVEADILELVSMLQTQFPLDRVNRTRCDEIWISSDQPAFEVERATEGFSAEYTGRLEYDWGVGASLSEAHMDLKRRKEESGVTRTQKGVYVVSRRGR